MSTSPPYVVFEGIDGSGKSTLCRRVFGALRAKGDLVAQLRMPGLSSMAGRLIRQILEGRAQFDPKAMIWLFAAELADMEPRIKEVRSEGVTVVCDRHTTFSALLYQGPEHGTANVEAILGMIAPTPPTHVYLVDVPAEVAVERQRRRTKDRSVIYESGDLAAVDGLRCRYLSMIDRAPKYAWPPKEVFKIIDGTLPVGANVSTILRDMKERR